MFNSLFNKYKLEVLETDFVKDIKDTPIYVKIFLAILILCSILSSIFGLLRWDAVSIVTVIVLIIDFIVLAILRNRKKERTRIVNEVIIPEANSRMSKMIDLLKAFDVEVKDENQLNHLIERAQEEKDYYDTWKGFRSLFKGTITYILLPIITIFLSEFFKDTDIITIIIRAAILLSVCAVFIVVIAAFAVNMRDFFNRDIRNLDYFIRDVEDIKIFNSKVDQPNSSSEAASNT